ncbi:hypothetical protein LTR50_007768 [Elasticomyces elasticus]|nr:hypothetical protein LTR50_007768 [Elasticomyces elasticus]
MALVLGRSAVEVLHRGRMLYICSVAMVVAAGLFVIARVSTRVARRNLGIDDYSIVAALASSIALSVTEIMGSSARSQLALTPFMRS